MIVTTKNDKVMLSDRAYSWGKKLVQVFLPAISALYFGLAKIWGFPDAEQVVGTIAVITTFMGVTLRISSSQFDQSGAAYDGTVKVTPNEDGTKVSLNVNPDDLVGKSAITLKVASGTQFPPV